LRSHDRRKTFLLELLHVEAENFDLLLLSDAMASSDGLGFNARIPSGSNEIYLGVIVL
jgi:hypothetical protein